MRQKIASFLIVCMALVQIGLAQHATVHVQEVISFEAASHQNHSDHSSKKLHDCQICASAKTFAHGLTSTPVLYEHTSTSSKLTYITAHYLSAVHVFSPYHARGPPSFLV